MSPYTTNPPSHGAPDEALRETHVSSAINKLDQATVDLQKNIDELSSRLECVRRAEAVVVQREDRTVSQKVGLAQAIEEGADRVRSISLQVRGILNTLEL